MTFIMAIYIASGVTLCSLGSMSLINASIEERRPRIAYFIVLVGCAAIFLGWVASPDGLRFEHVPRAFFEVFVELMR